MPAALHLYILFLAADAALPPGLAPSLFKMVNLSPPPPISSTARTAFQCSSLLPPSLHTASYTMTQFMNVCDDCSTHARVICAESK
jgi:hypothetical protein